jgi:uncharacterized protein YxjI
MRMLFKQRFFSWLDSYDIYDEDGNALYTVKGVLSWGHCLKVFDAEGRYQGMIKERVLSFMPRFEVYLGETYAGMIRKQFTFFRPKFDIEMNGWRVEGDWLEWNYEVLDGNRVAASVSKVLWRLTDTYQIEVERDQDALMALMIVLAIDAAKCSQSG